MEKLQNGEIDLMAALSYTDERAETMLFSDLPMGKEKYYQYFVEGEDEKNIICMQILQIRIFLRQIFLP